MIKLFALLPKREDVTLEQFHEHWRTTHRDYALRMRSLRRYVQGHRLASAPDGFPPAPFEGFEAAPYPGIAEAWFEDLAAAAGMGEDPDYTEGAKLDEPNFMDVDASRFLLTEENVVLEGPPVERDAASIKALLLLRRRPDMTPAQFRRRWHEQHAPLAGQIPGLTRYVQSHAAAETYAPEAMPPFDGVGELWWPDLDACRHAWTTPEMQRVLADAREFVGPGSSAALVEELRVIWP
jgi:uncharacterized protein (TIGR02118 family)